MGVYVPNWNIPESCDVCPLARTVYCTVLKAGDYVGGFQTRHTRNPKCPLIEINSPHGRLIDIDKLCDDLTAFYSGEKTARGLIYDQPVIIEEE